MVAARQNEGSDGLSFLGYTVLACSTGQQYFAAYTDRYSFGTPALRQLHQLCVSKITDGTRTAARARPHMQGLASVPVAAPSSFSLKDFFQSLPEDIRKPAVNVGDNCVFRMIASRM